MESSVGWEISNTNLSTGWCSLSMMTTTTFSASFWEGRVHTEMRHTMRFPSLTSAPSHVSPSRWGASHSEGCPGYTDSALGDTTSGNKQTRDLYSRCEWVDGKRWAYSEYTYLHRYIVFLSFLKYSRWINFTHIQNEMYGDLQELTQDVSNHWIRRMIEGKFSQLTSR